MLSETDEVFKLVGPALMKVELPDAKHNVGKRLELIETEIKRLDDKIAALQGEQSTLGDQVCLRNKCHIIVVNFATFL